MRTLPDGCLRRPEEEDRAGRRHQRRHRIHDPEFAQVREQDLRVRRGLGAVADRRPHAARARAYELGEVHVLRLAHHRDDQLVVRPRQRDADVDVIVFANAIVADHHRAELGMRPRHARDGVREHLKLRRPRTAIRRGGCFERGPGNVDGKRSRNDQRGTASQPEDQRSMAAGHPDLAHPFAVR